MLLRSISKHTGRALAIVPSQPSAVVASKLSTTIPRCRKLTSCRPGLLRNTLVHPALFQQRPQHRGFAAVTKSEQQIQKLMDTPKNKQIKASKVRIVGSEGTQIIDIREALAEARSKNMDLIWLGASKEDRENDIATCKLLDINAEIEKLREKAYSEQRARKKGADQPKKDKKLGEKALRLGSNINDHDFQFKLNKGREFLSKGHQLSILIELRRSKTLSVEDRAQRALDLVTRASEELADVGTEVVDQRKVMLGQIRAKYLPITK